MAFRPFYEIKHVLGDIIGKDLNGNTNNAAADWVRDNLSPRPEAFIGTNAQLMQSISQQSDSCAASVKKTGFFTGNNTARQVCQQEITKAYSNVLVSLQEETILQDNEAAIKAQKSTTVLYIIVAVVIVVILIALYL